MGCRQGSASQGVTLVVRWWLIKMGRTRTEPKLCFTVLIQRLFCALSFSAAVRQPCYAGRAGRLVTITSQDISAVWWLLFHCCYIPPFWPRGREKRECGRCPEQNPGQSRFLQFQWELSPLLHLSGCPSTILAVLPFGLVYFVVAAP